MSAVTHRQERAEGDRGAVLVLLALVLIGLLVIAALVVDIGGVYGERREDQNAADSAAMAAALALPNRTNAVAAAKQYAEDTLDVDFSNGDDGWDGCDDEAVPGGYTKVTGSNCIAISGSARRVLVRIPEQEYSTGFAKVVGLNSLDHSAFAIAGLTPLGFGGVLPFGLVGQTSSFLCADSGGGNTGFCKSSGSGVTPGNFGVADFAFWGDDLAGTSTDCGTSAKASQDRIANNVAVGVDHDLEKHPSPHPSPAAGAARKLDTGSAGFACPGTSAANSAQTITGENLGDEVGAGLWSGTNFSDGGDARLQRLGTLPNTPDWMTATANIGGFALDDIPLWEFIPTTFATGALVPRSCWRDQFTGGDGIFDTADDLGQLPAAVQTAITPLSDKDRVVVLMDRCFTHYGPDTTGPGSWAGVTANGVVINPPEAPCLAYSTDGGCSSPAPTQFTTPVFSRNTAVEAPLDLFDIQYTPRFAFVPRTTEPNGNQPRDFITFFTIYIQRVLAGCNAGSGCNVDFDPGVDYSNPTPANNVKGSIDALAVFVFPQSNILPNRLAYEDAAFRDNANRTRSLVR